MNAHSHNEDQILSEVTQKTVTSEVTIRSGPKKRYVTDIPPIHVNNKNGRGKMKVRHRYSLFILLSLIFWLDAIGFFTPIHPHFNTVSMNKLLAEKIRVQLRGDVPGLGKKGEITFVNPAYFSNSLQPKKLAVKVTSEDIERMQSREKTLVEIAQRIGARLNRKGLFSMKHKMGPNGQLFGSISVKEVTENIISTLPQIDESIKSLRDISIGDIFEANAETLSRGPKVSDIRKKGLYIVTLKLLPDLAPFETYLDILPDS